MHATVAFDLLTAQTMFELYLVSVEFPEALKHIIEFIVMPTKSASQSNVMLYNLFHQTPL